MISVEEIAKQTSFWAEYGLPGLVIFALFGLVFWHVYTHKAERKETCELHREERKEWRACSERQSDKLDGAFKDLTAAIREKRL